MEGRGKAEASVISRLTAEGEVGSDWKSTSVTGVIREKRVMHGCKNKKYHALTGILKRLHRENEKIGKSTEDLI